MHEMNIIKKIISINIQLIAEILELGGNVARDMKKTRIQPYHMFLAIKNDEELNEVFGSLTKLPIIMQPTKECKDYHKTRAIPKKKFIKEQLAKLDIKLDEYTKYIIQNILISVSNTHLSKQSISTRLNNLDGDILDHHSKHSHLESLWYIVLEVIISKLKEELPNNLSKPTFEILNDVYTELLNDKLSFLNIDD